MCNYILVLYVLFLRNVLKILIFCRNRNLLIKGAFQETWLPVIHLVQQLLLYHLPVAVLKTELQQPAVHDPQVLPHTLLEERIETTLVRVVLASVDSINSRAALLTARGQPLHHPKLTQNPGFQTSNTERLPSLSAPNSCPTAD